MSFLSLHERQSLHFNSKAGEVKTVSLISVNREIVKMTTDLQLLLQGSGGTLATVLIHHHHHVRQRVHLHLLRLQVVLKLLEWENAGRPE